MSQDKIKIKRSELEDMYDIEEDDITEDKTVPTIHLETDEIKIESIIENADKELEEEFKDG